MSEHDNLLINTMSKDEAEDLKGELFFNVLKAVELFGDPNLTNDIKMAVDKLFIAFQIGKISLHEMMSRFDSVKNKILIRHETASEMLFLTYMLSSPDLVEKIVDILESASAVYVDNNIRGIETGGFIGFKSVNGVLQVEIIEDKKTRNLRIQASKPNSQSVKITGSYASSFTRSADSVPDNDYLAIYSFHTHPGGSINASRPSGRDYSVAAGYSDGSSTLKNSNLLRGEWVFHPSRKTKKQQCQNADENLIDELEALKKWVGKGRSSAISAADIIYSKVLRCESGVKYNVIMGNGNNQQNQQLLTVSAIGPSSNKCFPPRRVFRPDDLACLLRPTPVPQFDFMLKPKSKMLLKGIVADQLSRISRAESDSSPSEVENLAEGQSITR